MYHANGAFDRVVDVAVVGFGAAGAVTAMTAHDLGKDVLIIEKQPEDARRPNSRFSGGIFINPRDVDAAVQFMKVLYRIDGDLYETDPAVLRTWAEETSQNADWWRAIGGSCDKLAASGEHPSVEGNNSIDVYCVTTYAHSNGNGHSGLGWGLFKLLS